MGKFGDTMCDTELRGMLFGVFSPFSAEKWGLCTFWEKYDYISLEAYSFSPESHVFSMSGRARFQPVQDFSQPHLP